MLFVLNAVAKVATTVTKVGNVRVLIAKNVLFLDLLKNDVTMRKEWRVSE